MALMVPDVVPSKASEGEKRLYKTLQYELPDDCLVWYEPQLKGLYPDFIVLGATLGLLILEVKGWKASQIVRANSQFFEIENGEQKTESQQSPLRQGKSYLDALLDKLKRYPVLTQPDGDYQGKLAFPLGLGVVMTNITAAKSQEENIYSLLEQPQVAYRDELMAWDGIGERQLIRRLEQMFTHRFQFMALTDDQISTIKGIIYPEKAIKEKPATFESVPGDAIPPSNSSIIVTLDLQQERLAASIRNGHRLFYGVAGSGKTLILLSRAKLIANRLFDHRVLILCFNIILASHLRSLIYHESANSLFSDRIEVIHFHAWAKNILGRLPNPHQITENYDEVVGEQLLAAIASLPLEKKWDAILVDEAHTFAPNWFKCCVSALKDPENGDLMIVSDASQSLYQRSKFTWKSVGINIQGRTKKLVRNYRNTQEILSAAWGMIQQLTPEEEPEDTAFPVVVPDTALRRGIRPIFYLESSRTQEVNRAIAQIQILCQSGYQPEDIAIIYRYQTKIDAPLLQHLQQQLDNLGHGCYRVTETKQSYHSRQPGVRLITALSSLGLEFKLVLILWVQQFGDRHSQQPDTSVLARRQLYVAMTRAQEQLYLFGSGNLPIIHELQSSQYIELRL